METDMKKTSSLFLSSLLCIAGVGVLVAAGPATEPSVAPSGATSLTLPTAVTTPAAPTARTTDDRNTNRNNRNNNNRGNRNFGRGGGNNNYNPGTGTETTSDAAEAAKHGDYSGIPTRSIFLKGNQDLVVHAPPVVEAPRPVVEPTGGFRGKSEQLLIFNGAVIEDNAPAAFVEDLKTNLVLRVRPGDAVAGGVVSAVTLDELTYLVGGSIRHVRLGQDFTGNAAISSSIAPAAPPTLTVGGVQVIGTGASIPVPVAAAGSGISKEDMEARMRARREQESKGSGTK